MESSARDQESDQQASIPILTNLADEDVGDGVIGKGSDSDEEEKDTIEEGWMGWFVVLASFLCNMVIDGMGYSFGVMLDPLKEDFQAGAGSVAFVGSILSGVTMLTAPVAAASINRSFPSPIS